MTRALVIVAIALSALGAARLAAAQALAAADREALVALHVSRGGRAGDLDPLIAVVNEAGGKGLPIRPLADKIREGVSKRAQPARIEQVVRQMAADLDVARGLVREWTPDDDRTRQDVVVLLGEALSGPLTPDTERRGLTADEARELGRQMRAARSGLPADAIAHGARGLAFIKDAGLPVADGTALMTEAARRGFRDSDLLDLGRHVKLREREYQSGRATLGALRDAVARGERPERLFRERPERPAARPQAPDRPERPVRPEAPARPERPGRP